MIVILLINPIIIELYGIIKFKVGKGCLQIKTHRYPKVLNFFKVFELFLKGASAVREYKGFTNTFCF